MSKLRPGRIEGVLGRVAFAFCAFSLLSCGQPTVRYDAAPDVISANHHTVLLETDCGGVTRLGMGQAGCSFGAEEIPSGRLTIHTPLPGSIRMISKACGIDRADYHPDQGGSFRYELSDVFGQVPASVTNCIVDVLVSWQLPPKMKTEYPLSGMRGRFYYRKRAPDRKAALFAWEPSFNAMGGGMVGVAYSQFRASPPGAARDVIPTNEPLVLKMRVDEPLQNATFRLAGCGQGIESAPFEGMEAVVPRDALLGSNPALGSCLLFGFVQGTRPDGSQVIFDAAVGVDIFDHRAVKLSGQVELKDGELCYSAEDSVTLVVLHHEGGNLWKNSLTGCFPMPEDGKARLAFFTHKGRAVYAIVNGSQIDYVQ